MGVVGVTASATSSNLEIASTGGMDRKWSRAAMRPNASERPTGRHDKRSVVDLMVVGWSQGLGKVPNVWFMGC